MVASSGGLLPNHWPVSIAFSPDSERLACCGHIKGRTPFVQILSVDKGSRLAILEGLALDYNDPILQLACAWLPDKLIFACLSRSTLYVRIWDPHTFEPLSSWQDVLPISHGSPSLLLSHDGRRLAVAAIYDPSKGAMRPTWGHPSAANIPLCVLQDLETGGPHEVLRARGNQGDVRAASFDREGERLALSFADHTIRIWSVATRELVLSVAEPIPLEFDPCYHLYNRISSRFLSLDVSAKAVAFSPDGRHLLSLRYMRVEDRLETLVILWDTLTGRPLLRWDDTRSPGVYRNSGLAAFTPCGRYVAFAANDGRVHVFDLSCGGLSVRSHWRSRSEDVSMQLRPLSTSWHVAESLVFSSDGQTLCWGTRDGGVEIRLF
ncbi:hypothetical protein GSI_15571 [Ganoderma sinense ZZ0214-1]|uniref:Uncharacterized protein n=1 Tax=Ganoderma sinense ZZ0214-1 TaxID=1077348 RepID=A0A2G8RMX9_9APHY|nr:hypothetical protein GSI_15571 [Ganoderma sinense ZZ0214-1]